jgi:glutamyl-tRNA synthetase
VTFGKLDFLQKGHAKLRAHVGGPAYEELVESIYNHAKTVLPLEVLEPSIRTKSLRERISHVLLWVAKTYLNPCTFVAENRYFFCPLEKKPAYSIAELGLQDEEIYVPALEELKTTIEESGAEISWTAELLKPIVQNCVQARLAKMTSSLEGVDIEDPKILDKRANTRSHKFLRWAIAGGQHGPGLMETMEILGPEITLDRLRKAEEEAIQASMSQSTEIR